MGPPALSLTSSVSVSVNTVSAHSDHDMHKAKLIGKPAGMQHMAGSLMQDMLQEDDIAAAVCVSAGQQLQSPL